MRLYGMSSRLSELCADGTCTECCECVFCKAVLIYRSNRKTNTSPRPARKAAEDALSLSLSLSHTHTHTHRCLCMYLCIVCARSCVCIYIYLFIYTYIHLFIFIYWRLWGVPCEPTGEISSSCNVIWTDSLSKSVTETGRNWVAQGDASDLYPEDTVLESWLELSRFRCYVVFFSPQSLLTYWVSTFKYSATTSQYIRMVVTWLSSHVFAFLSSVAVRVFFLLAGDAV